MDFIFYDNDKTRYINVDIELMLELLRNKKNRLKINTANVCHELFNVQAMGGGRTYKDYKLTFKTYESLKLYKRFKATITKCMVSTFYSDWGGQIQKVEDGFIITAFYD